MTERVERVGCAVRTFDDGEGAHSAPYQHDRFNRVPFSPVGREEGWEKGQG